MSTSDDDRQILPFAAALAQIGNGEAAARASRLLNELVTAVVATGKKGTLTIKIDVAPFKKRTTTLDVTATSALNAPKGDDDAVSGIFFHADGNLRRDDPTQLTLPLRDASKEIA